ncbi:MAG: 4Fe-4S dicluster domain-containing protein [Proteobacteria bacterium]|nr:4Fe-4S dicluster domain-containing protein [Pseudomonadota bacterium]
MVPIRIKKGYTLNVEGRPSLDVEVLKTPARVAAVPEKIPFIKPGLAVQVGDAVEIGSVLFVDKRNPGIKFLSPGCGTVEQINFGPRRVIREIVIKLDQEESCKAFESVSEDSLEHLARERIIQLLTDGGLWPLIREFPFRDIAGPANIPPAIFVSLDAGEPFQPGSQVYLEGHQSLFAYGIRILRRLARDKVYVSARRDNPIVSGEYKQFITHHYIGDYPADDPGVLLYYLRKSTAENRAWYISGQDVLLMARLLKNGRYPVERIVTLAGSSVQKPRHVRTRLGVPLAHLAGSRNDGENTRHVVGGLFRGYPASKNDFLGFYETALTLLPEGRREEVLGFVRPGFTRPTYSRTFLSVFNTSALKMDCNRHGGIRACIACGYCAEVCPVDILPQLTFKAVLADEVEAYLAHGLLDCVECGLCTYVCPSKIELKNILVKAKAAYYKELTA